MFTEGISTSINRRAIWASSNSRYAAPPSALEGPPTFRRLQHRGGDRKVCSITITSPTDLRIQHINLILHENKISELKPIKIHYFSNLKARFEASKGDLQQEGQVGVSREGIPEKSTHTPHSDLKGIAEIQSERLSTRYGGPKQHRVKNKHLDLSTANNATSILRESHDEDQ